jgi:ABC-2 type transport system permease protein
MSEPVERTPLSDLAVVRLLVRREVVQRVRSKVFLVTTAITVVVIVAAVVIPSLLRSDDVSTVVLVGRDSGATAAQIVAVARAVAPDLRLETPAMADEGAARAALADGTADAALIDGREVLVQEQLDSRLESILQAAHRQAAITESLAGTGLSADRLSQVLSPPPLTVNVLVPKQEGASERQVMAFLGTVLLYMQLLMSGAMIAQGVVEEKTSRVIELLLGKARPSLLLTGKVMGMGLVAFVQLLVIVLIGLGAALAAGTLTLPAGAVSIAALVLGWFVLGFAIYACLFAMAGALAGRPEDLQSTSGLVSLLAIGGYAAGAAAVADPDGPVARIAAFLPPTAPLVEPVRMASGVAPWWEPIVVASILVASMIVLIRLAARVYAGGALHFAGTLKLRDALSRADTVGGVGPAEPGPAPEPAADPVGVGGER